VAAVLPKVNGERMGSGLETDAAQRDRIGFRCDTGMGIAVPGLPEGGDVVDVHAQANHGEKIPRIVG
jgi:hypothetical protein